MSSKLTQILAKGQALVPYFTYGDYSIAYSEQLIIDAAQAGASAIEIGMPFSDPIADGPVIQASHLRALIEKPDISIDDLLGSIQRIKQVVDTPLIIMIASTLIYKYGIARFFQNMAEYQVAGVVIPDLIVDDATEWIQASRAAAVDLIFLVSVNTNEQRIQKITALSTGFVYLVSVTGVTGQRDQIDPALNAIVDKIHAIKDIPVLVGFGISQSDHVKQVNTFCQGVIIGSELVRLIPEKSPRIDTSVVIDRLRDLI